MRFQVFIGGAVIAVAGATFAIAQQPAPPAPPPRVPGYLTPETAPQIAQIIPPPPVEGGDRQKTDLDTFRATRALKGTPRWDLATADVSYEIGYLMKAFSCSVGAELTPDNAPKTAMLIRRVLRDTGLTSNSAKDVFQRKRPYLYVEGDICVAKSEDLARSPDYPSGHSTLSWGAGLVLAELVPQRSTQILARARAYGDSRVVCGVHSVSAVEQGRITASATVAAEHGVPEFRADLEGARTELAALRATSAASNAGSCQAEAALIAKSPY